MGNLVNHTTQETEGINWLIGIIKPSIVPNHEDSYAKVSIGTGERTRKTMKFR